MKITVRIHTASGLKVKKYRLSDDGTKVLIRKESKKKAGWNPEIGTMEVKHKLFGRVAYFVDVYPEASKTWVIDPSKEAVDMPKWDKQQSKKYIEAKMIEKAGTELKEKPGMALYILAFLVIANIVVTLVSSGRLRFG